MLSSNSRWNDLPCVRLAIAMLPASNSRKRSSSCILRIWWRLFLPSSACRFIPQSQRAAYRTAGAELNCNQMESVLCKLCSQNTIMVNVIIWLLHPVFGIKRVRLNFVHLTGPSLILHSLRDFCQYLLNVAYKACKLLWTIFASVSMMLLRLIDVDSTLIMLTSS